MEALNIFLWLEDFDNPELDDYEYTEQLRDAVLTYNGKYNTQYAPDATVKRYLRIKQSLHE